MNYFIKFFLFIFLLSSQVILLKKAEASLEEHLHQYVPRWIYQISSIGTGKTVEEEIKDFESIFHGMQPILERQAQDPALIKILGERGNPNITLYGAGELNGVHFEGNIISFGSLLLRDIKAHNLRVEGILSGYDVHLKEIHVQGPAKLDKSEISGPVKILGDFAAQNTFFTNKVCVSGPRVIFSGCKIQGDLHINPSAGEEEQRVYLIKGTEIQGKIIFLEEENKAKHRIFKDASSNIHGEIINATLEQIKKD